MMRFLPIFLLLSAPLLARAGIARTFGAPGVAATLAEKEAAVLEAEQMMSGIECEGGCDFETSGTGRPGDPVVVTARGGDDKTKTTTTNDKNKPRKIKPPRRLKKKKARRPRRGRAKDSQEANRQGEELFKFYVQQIQGDPVKLQLQLAKVPSLVAKYEGRYGKMWAVLKKKYVLQRGAGTAAEAKNMAAAEAAAMGAAFAAGKEEGVGVGEDMEEDTEAAAADEAAAANKIMYGDQDIVIAATAAANAFRAAAGAAPLSTTAFLAETAADKTGASGGEQGGTVWDDDEEEVNGTGRVPGMYESTTPDKYVEAAAASEEGGAPGEVPRTEQQQPGGRVEASRRDDKASKGTFGGLWASLTRSISDDDEVEGRVWGPDDKFPPVLSPSNVFMSEPRIIVHHKPSIDTNEQEDSRQGAELRRFYNKHITSNKPNLLQQQLAKVPSLVAKYEGRYPKMWQILENKYVVEPKAAAEKKKREDAFAMGVRFAEEIVKENAAKAAALAVLEGGASNKKEEECGCPAANRCEHVPEPKPQCDTSCGSVPHNAPVVDATDVEWPASSDEIAYYIRRLVGTMDTGAEDDEWCLNSVVQIRPAQVGLHADACISRGHVPLHELAATRGIANPEAWFKAVGAMALEKLTKKNMANRVAVRTAGGVPALVSVVRTAADSPGQEFVYKDRYNNGGFEFADNDARLVHGLHEYSPGKWTDSTGLVGDLENLAKEYAARALLHLGLNKDNAEAIVREGGVPALLR